MSYELYFTIQVTRKQWNTNWREYGANAATFYVLTKEIERITIPDFRRLRKISKNDD